jgi:hypothetical protein
MISTYTEEELNHQFKKTLTQISPAFVKDIVSHFSSYYARQGQPDIDHGRLDMVIDANKKLRHDTLILYK